MSAIEFIHVEKRYGERNKPNFRAIHDFNASINSSELIVIVGPSGCGKSTLLRMVAGLEDISAGQITINGRIVNHLDPARRNVAMVFQNYALYPHMSVRANMAYALKIAGMPKADIEHRVQHAASILGLIGMLDRKPRELSGGQRQRVAMGRAIVRQPAAFLFDEPLSNLDATLRAQTRLEIQKLHRRLAATMLFVTHDQIEAMTLADRMIVMNAGRIEQFDTPESVYNRPASSFVAGFIGSPAMNLLRNVTGTPDGQILGIRPEHISLQSHQAKQGDTPFCGIRAITETIELLGAERLIHARIGDESVIVRVNASDPIPGIGESLSVTFPTHQLHWFDAHTGLRIAA